MEKKTIDEMWEQFSTLVDEDEDVAHYVFGKYILNEDVFKAAMLEYGEQCRKEGFQEGKNSASGKPKFIPDKSTLGGRIKAERIKKGITLRQVESETGISNSYMSQLETNKIKYPAAATIYKIADYYRVHPDVLMREPETAKELQP